MTRPAELPDTRPLAVSSPSSSLRSDGSNMSTYPPTPTEALTQAREGPQCWSQNDWHWDFVEWDAVRSQYSESMYESRKRQLVLHERSICENKECERRNEQEWNAIRDLRWIDPDQYYLKKKQRERSLRDLHLRLEGWTQEQIDAMDREAEAASEARRIDILNNPPPRTQEEKERSQAMLRKAKEMRDRMFAEYESKHGRGSANRWKLEPSPQPEDTSRKVRGGRVTKLAARSKSDTRGHTRSRQRAPTSAKTQGRRRGPARTKRVPEEPGSGVAPRRSRRLAGELPEFGTRPSDAPPRGQTLRGPHLETRKTSTSDSRRSKRSKKPVAAKSAKP
ncbi:hypothetical protein HRG_001287 [Hirsutella rhossiliensis]|uniref:Uncharacterized protein n=1 Tax=Hirsutella rhossiliensis TaxID=111463 RepID=A0A9P8SP76_9HYPO|nr:uncharacterized protein HRG_01287 [Hirsutella rhossiliensis]KAH0968645.1 hypothetical protein HRG_01287 [Hirsutella rhossiliensis]